MVAFFNTSLSSRRRQFAKAMIRLSDSFADLTALSIACAPR
jgi:hypothetical protein